MPKPLTDHTRRLGPADDVLRQGDWRACEAGLPRPWNAATVRTQPKPDCRLEAKLTRRRTVQTLQSYLTPVQNAVRNPSALASKSAQAAASTADTALTNPQSFLTRLRNLDSAALGTVAIITAETIGFFSVGEIIGRFKIVGYRGETHAHH